ncbi:hypothetical protein H7J51_18350 [Mycobacterium crocinum]|uniref:Uncharacterized protein n=1 Tax=Mycolicibacterium crocinum TaxID=388459 RepID=A0ABY3TPS2_9MYCO|nr:hypothetical protein [Mycolicibacterium crocinum]MCV7217237.1 hypothetical protein [Mycolicibacterium crocinum]ULN42970.1 hypothetical protein MI149_07755 [Mycolicibacterium crocinum]
MTTNRFKALIAAPAIAAAVLGGAALTLAGPASATTTLNDYSPYTDSSTTGNFYAPTTYATPATTYVPWGAWINGSY